MQKANNPEKRSGKKCASVALPSWTSKTPAKQAFVSILVYPSSITSVPYSDNSLSYEPAVANLKVKMLHDMSHIPGDPRV